MTPDRDIRHEDPEAFLQRKERNSLYMSGTAAEQACLRAVEAGLAILGVEGGQWLNPGIEARLDSIWCVKRAPVSRAEAERWNTSAAEFIRDQVRESPDPDYPPAYVFILTARRIDLSA